MAHFELGRRLFGALTEERGEISNGYEFRFPPDALTELTRFIENERKCCPFLSFRLTIPPSNQSIWVLLDGPEGTRDFLDREFATVGSR